MKLCKHRFTFEILSSLWFYTRIIHASIEELKTFHNKSAPSLPFAADILLYMAMRNAT